MKKHLIYILGLIPLFLSCEKLFIEPVENTPRDNFESLWKSYDLHYSCFVYKNINWDSIHYVYNDRINNKLTDDQLFNLLSEILGNLKDKHVWLVTDKRFYVYEKPDQYTYYYNYSNIINYLSSVQNQNMFIYGKLEGNIGYFHISTFKLNQNGYDFIDTILKEFSECTGIVIDIRSNAGGSDNNAKLIASRFYDKKRAYDYRKLRNGPKHDDFTDKVYDYAEPSKNARPDIPIVLLTDRSVGSAGEDFTLMMRILPQVTVVGDYTGGNPGGSPILRELQNGWIYYTPTGLQYTMDDEIFIDKGMKPDTLVTEVQTGKDMMIEKAVEILK
jgi:hypothetical protein